MSCLYLTFRPLDFVRDMAVEDPGDSPILFARYGQQVMKENTTNFLPFFGTDIGLCSLVKPQLSFNEVGIKGVHCVRGCVILLF